MAGNSGPGFKQYPEHRVDLQRGPERVQVIFNGEPIADSRDVITVEETGHDPVYYFPRQDVQMQRLIRTDHHTRCPFKGEHPITASRTIGLPKTRFGATRGPTTRC